MAAGPGFPGGAAPEECLIAGASRTPHSAMQSLLTTGGFLHTIDTRAALPLSPLSQSHGAGHSELPGLAPPHLLSGLHSCSCCSGRNSVPLSCMRDPWDERRVAPAKVRLCSPWAARSMSEGSQSCEGLGGPSFALADCADLSPSAHPSLALLCERSPCPPWRASSTQSFPTASWQQSAGAGFLLWPVSLPGG